MLIARHLSLTFEYQENTFLVPYNRINIATDVKSKKSVESMMNRDDIKSVFFPKET